MKIILSSFGILFSLSIFFLTSTENHSFSTEQLADPHIATRVVGEGGYLVSETGRRRLSDASKVEQRGVFSSVTTHSKKTKSQAEIDVLSSDEQQSLWKAFAQARHAVRKIPSGWAERPENRGFDYYALNPKQHLTTRFGRAGVGISSADQAYTEEDLKNPHTAWKAMLKLESFAGSALSRDTVAQKPAEQNDRIEYHHTPTLSEWYINGSEGIEHGYTVTQRPAHLKKGAQVTIGISLAGLQAVQGEDAGKMIFKNGDREVLSYSKLKVVDATGKELPASMQATTSGILLAYHDAGAIYPVTVDPLISSQEKKLTANDASAGDNFAKSVAISGDTVVIGSSGDDDGGSSSGSTYVFQRVGNTWSEQQKLTASDASADDYFGYSVAISGDTIVVGVFGDNDGGTNSGSTYVFQRVGGTWSEQQKLTASDAMVFDNFGKSVAVSGDTVVIGSYLDDDGGSSSGSTYVFQRVGGTWSEQQKLTASDASAGDYFGYSVAISGDTVVIGSYLDDDGGSSSGSTYVFQRVGGTWSEQQKLTSNDASVADNFGYSVAISGDTVVIGAYGDDDGGSSSGSTYVFQRVGSTWSEQQKLTANDASVNDFFGRSVAISGDTVVIGAFGDDDGGATSGSSYVFQRVGSTWSEQQKLTASDASTLDYFGKSVAISGDTVVIGAYGDNDGGINSGSSYVFQRVGSTWNEQQKLTANDASALDYFGYSVAISGDTVVIGAYGDDDGGSSSGSTYVFQRVGSTWSEQQKLTANDASAADFFGKSVAISGDTVVIGAYGDDDGGSLSGSTYVFQRVGSTWSEQQKLTASDASAGDYFGYSVAISGDTVVIGSYLDDDGGSSSGSTYVFQRVGGTWSEQQKLTSNDASVADYFGYSVAISGDTVVIGAHGDNDGGSNSGSTYVFQRVGSTWSAQQKLTVSDASALDYFGYSVAISGDTVVIGSYLDDDGGSNSGSSYVFHRVGSTWSEQQKLTANDASASDFFGKSVAISGDTVVIGASGDNDGGSNSGSTYVFQRVGGTWSEQQKLTANDATALNYFGYSVAISGDTVVIGGYGDDDGGADSGSAYIFRLVSSGVRELMVFDHASQNLSIGEAAQAFQGLKLGSSGSYTFRLINTGQLPLDLQSLSLSGAHAGEFSLTVPDILSNPDLSTGEWLEVTVTFSPTGVSSGERNAIMIIISNDTSNSVFTVHLSGLGLSESEDGDEDGMNDWGEYALKVFGFDWETPQINLVNHFNDNVSNAGFYKPSEIAGINAEVKLINVNKVTNKAELIFELEESADLSSFNSIIANPGNLSVDGDGNIRYDVDAALDKKFYHVRIK